MAVKYRVERNGKVVWEGRSAAYDFATIPREHLERPTKGNTKIFVDNELIATQVAMTADEAAAHAAVLKAEGRNPDGTTKENN